MSENMNQVWCRISQDSEKERLEKVSEREKKRLIEHALKHADPRILKEIRLRVWSEKKYKHMKESIKFRSNLGKIKENKYF